MMKKKILIFVPVIILFFGLCDASAPEQSKHSHHDQQKFIQALTKLTQEEQDQVKRMVAYRYPLRKRNKAEYIKPEYIVMPEETHRLFHEGQEERNKLILDAYLAAHPLNVEATHDMSSSMISTNKGRFFLRDEETILTKALSSQKPSLINIVLKYKPDVQRRNGLGETPLHVTVKCCNHASLAIIQHLVQEDADVTARCYDKVHYVHKNENEMSRPHSPETYTPAELALRKLQHLDSDNTTAAIINTLNYNFLAALQNQKNPNSKLTLQKLPK